MIPEPGKGWRRGRGLQLLPDCQDRAAMVMDLRKVNTLTSPPHTFQSSAGTCIGWRRSKSKVRLPDADSGREEQRMNLGSGEKDGENQCKLLDTLLHLSVRRANNPPCGLSQFGVAVL